MQGLLTISGKETKDLGFWGILFEGRDFLCCEKTRKDFEKFLESLPTDEVEVTFLHSMEVHLDPSRPKKKKYARPLPNEPKPESVNYNCTVRGTKDFARHVFKNKEDQLNQYIDIIWPIAERLAREERKLKAANQNQTVDQPKP